MAWLFEARKRYGLSILNYIVTSNHVHLLVSGDGDRDAIPKSIQLLAGKTGQEYIRERSAREHSGKIVIMLQQLSALCTWLDA